MIYVNITGGLGNQLFQYAFAKRIQLETHEEICLNIFELEHYDKKRTFCLNNYKLINDCSVSKKKLPWFVHRRNYFSKIIRKIDAKLFYKFGKTKNSYIWYLNDRIELFEANPNKDVYIGGYWQDPSYSLPAINEIRESLQLCSSLSKENNLMIEEMQAGNSVCVHIRRGDYVGTAYEVCTIDYYLTAITEMKNIVPEAMFYIFSDDNEWVEQNFILDESFCLIPQGNPAHLDLYLMSKCKHFIISNSTFSWWAQYLGENSEKVVFAPNKWHRDNESMSLFMPEWRLIDID